MLSLDLMALAELISPSPPSFICLLEILRCGVGMRPRSLVHCTQTSGIFWVEQLSGSSLKTPRSHSLVVSVRTVEWPRPCGLRGMSQTMKDSHSLVLLSLGL